MDYYNFLNDKNRTFVIAEAGSNWKCGNYEEDLKRSKELIKIASMAGADAIKFQTYRPETIYVPNAGKSRYLSEHGINQNINDIFEYLSMPYEMIPELAEICKKENILFMSTPFSVRDAEKIDQDSFGNNRQRGFAAFKLFALAGWLRISHATGISIYYNMVDEKARRNETKLNQFNNNILKRWGINDN